MAGPLPRVLVLLASTDRRGAEIEGERLTCELHSSGIDAEVAALVAGAAPSLDVPVLGDRPLAPSTLLALRRRSRKADLVIAYGSSTLPACAIGLMGTRTPFVYRSIGDPRAWVRGGLHRRRTGWMMRRAERVVALWPGAAEAIAELYVVDPAKIEVIPNARSAEEFSPAQPTQRHAARAVLGIADDATVVSLIGSLTHEKRPELAIDAVALLPEANLLVVGDGPLRKEAERRARELLGARAIFLGAITSVAEVYAATDVVLSTSSTEGMSGVLIEAALAGVPVCATDVGAASWLVSNGASGSLFRAGSDPATVTEALRDAISRRPTDAPRLPFDWSDVVPLWRVVLEVAATRRQ